MNIFKKYIVLITGMCLALAGNTQNINFAVADSSVKHQLTLATGIEYGMIFSFGYAAKVHSGKMPAYLNIEYSFPSGGTIFDDFKVKTGLVIRWCEIKNFVVSTRINGVFRRYQTTFARLVNFGSDMAATAGYYHKKWNVAAEVGFDKAIITHFKHSAYYRMQYSEVADGWYEPPTGGNFYYGIQLGRNIGKTNIFLKAGKVISQDFKTTPMIPFYAQTGVTVKL